MIKSLHYRSFLSVFPAISEHWQETFFQESVFLKPEILDKRPVALEKRQFCKGVLEFLIKRKLHIVPWKFYKVFGAAISKYRHEIICDGV